MRHFDGAPADVRQLEAMARLMAHRGPDESATWTGDGIGFAHTRLSVIDLAGSRQPMRSADGRYRLVFGQGAEFFGRYLEVTPPSRLSWTNEESGEAGSITTVTFEERDGRTLVTLSELFPSKEAFEAGAGAADAMGETFAQLDELLVTLAADGM